MPPINRLKMNSYFSDLRHQIPLVQCNSCLFSNIIAISGIERFVWQWSACLSINSTILLFARCEAVGDYNLGPVLWLSITEENPRSQSIPVSQSRIFCNHVAQGMFCRTGLYWSVKSPWFLLTRYKNLWYQVSCKIYFHNISSFPHDPPIIMYCIRQPRDNGEHGSSWKC